MPLYNPIDSTAIIDGTITSADLAASVIDNLLPFPQNVSGRWYGPTVFNTTTASTSAGTLNQALYQPILLSDGTLDRIAVNHFGSATASEVARLGIYRASTTDPSLPGTLLLDAGTVDLSTATAVKTITISQAVTRGMYWLCVARQGPTNTATLVTLPIPAQGMQSLTAPPVDSTTLYNSSRTGLIQNSMAGALPGTATPVQSGAVTFVYASAVRYV